MKSYFDILKRAAAMTIVVAALAMPFPHRVQCQQNVDITSLLGGVAEEMTTHASIDYILGTVDYNSWRDTYKKMETSPGSFRITGFYRPVPGLVTSHFGYRAKYGRIHHGIDLSLREGDTVRAAMAGVVEKVAYDFNGYGHYVILKHARGMETLYGHLHHPIVRKGDIVGMGMPVGIGGNTGKSTGPHLHLETRMNGIAVDPMLVYDFTGHVKSFTPPSTFNLMKQKE